MNNFLPWLVPASLNAVHFHNYKTWATRETKQKKKWQEGYVKDLLALCLLMLIVEDYKKNELHPEHFRFYLSIWKKKYIQIYLCLLRPFTYFCYLSKVWLTQLGHLQILPRINSSGKE